MRVRLRCSAPPGVTSVYRAPLVAFEEADVADAAEARRLFGRPRLGGRYAGWIVDEVAPFRRWRVELADTATGEEHVFWIDAADAAAAISDARLLATVGGHRCDPVPVCVAAA